MEHITIRIPQIETSFDERMDSLRLRIGWGDASQDIMMTLEFLKYRPEALGETITEVLKNLCKKAKPFSYAQD